MSQALYLDESDLPAFAYNSALAESKVQLYFSQTTQTNDPGTAAFQLLQNRPNPFSGVTTIGFVLPEAGQATLRVFDLHGRLLREQTAWYGAGEQVVDFDVSDDTASGMLTYELTTARGVLMGNMMLVRG